MKVSRTNAEPEKSIQGRFRTCINKKCGHRVYTEEKIVIFDLQKKIYEERGVRMAQMRQIKAKKAKESTTA
jgi:hypothetical protein